MFFSSGRLSLLVSVAIICSFLPVANAQFGQQGSKLVGSGTTGPAAQGWAVGLSGDGNTAMMTGPVDNYPEGPWTFTRANSAWSQQGGRLPADPTFSSPFAFSVALSADGNTSMVGDYRGVAWYTRANGVWSQSGRVVTYSGTPLDSSVPVGISADGNTAIAAGQPGTGGVVFSRNNGIWSQQGSNLVGTFAVGSRFLGHHSVAISGDGNTAAVASLSDFTNIGAAWIFTRTNGVWSQQGNKLVGTGAVDPAEQGSAVALSYDGSTLIVGGWNDNGGAGASWIFTRASGAWSQQGGKLVGSGGFPTGPASPTSFGQGGAVAMSGDGNTVAVGADGDNNNVGAAWAFQRVGGVWSQAGGKLTGSDAVGQSYQGDSVAISGDGTTVIVGGRGDNHNVGAAWVYVTPAPPAITVPSAEGVSPAGGSGTSQVLTFTFSDTGGWQRLSVLDVLIRDVLDGRQSCYVAFVPSGANAGSVYLVDDAGDAGGPYSGMVLPGSDSVFNGQCSIAGAGSSVTTTGNSLTLTLAISFTPGFGGNKVIYLAARDPAGNSGWQALGTLNAPGFAPNGPWVGGVSPAHGTGFSQTYTYTFTDTNGWQDLSVVNVLINSAINGVKACYVAFVASGPGSGTVYLVDDAGDSGGSFAGPYSATLLPGTGTASNSQCAIASQGSSVTGSGNTLTLRLAITFSQSFSGNQVTYLAARSNTLNSGWQAVGTISVR